MMVVGFVFKVFAFSKEILPNGVQSDVVKVFGESAQHSQGIKLLCRQIPNLIFLSDKHIIFTKTAMIVSENLVDMSICSAFFTAEDSRKNRKALRGYEAIPCLKAIGFRFGNNL